MSAERELSERERRLVETVRRACLDAVIEGHERASIMGLCGEGAFEYAVDTLRRLELEQLIDGDAPRG